MNQKLKQSQSSSKPIEKAFYTDLNEKSEIEEHEGRLRKYVDQIDRKIDYAKWKQDLVLKYNYMPMKRITEKAQNQKINYLRRISEEQDLSAKMLSGKEITVQLDLFREFSKRLKQKQQQLMLRITEEKAKNDLLSKEVEEKRRRLKQKMKENMQAIKQSLKEQGITKKQDIITLFRSKSMKDNFKAGSLTSRTQAVKKISERKLSSQNSKRQPTISSIKLFQKCLNQLVAAIKPKSSSQYLQSETSLKKVQNLDQNSLNTQKRNTKSQILQTLYSKAGSSYQKYLKYSTKKSNFEMNWDEFKHLDCKNMLQLIIEKDNNCQKLKRILKYK